MMFLDGMRIASDLSAREDGVTDFLIGPGFNAAVDQGGGPPSSNHRIKEVVVVT